MGLNILPDNNYHPKFPIQSWQPTEEAPHTIGRLNSFGQETDLIPTGKAEQITILLGKVEYQLGGRGSWKTYVAGSDNDTFTVPDNSHFRLRGLSPEVRYECLYLDEGDIPVEPLVDTTRAQVCDRMEFNDLLTRQLLEIAEKISPLLLAFPDIYPAPEEVAVHVQQFNKFPKLKRDLSLADTEAVLAFFQGTFKDTPVSKMEFEGAAIWTKYTSAYPSGSHYDAANASLFMAKTNDIFKATKLVDNSSGSHAASMALFSWLLSKPADIYMPETNMPLRSAIPQALGAEVILTDREKGVDGTNEAIRANIRAILRSGGFLNHSESDDTLPGMERIAREIINQVEGPIEKVVMVGGNGTTRTGIGEIIKAAYPSVEFIIVRDDSGTSAENTVPGNATIRTPLSKLGIIKKDTIIQVTSAQARVWRSDKDRKRLYGLTTAQSRVGCLEALAQDLIKPGDTVVLLDFEPGERCEIFE